MKVTAKEAIDYSSISNINRLINIDWCWLISSDTRRLSISSIKYAGNSLYAAHVFKFHRLNPNHKWYSIPIVQKLAIYRTLLTRVCKDVQKIRKSKLFDQFFCTKTTRSLSSMFFEGHFSGVVLNRTVLGGYFFRAGTKPRRLFEEQNRTEQNRTEKNRTEQNRTEQNRTEQNRYWIETNKQVDTNKQSYVKHETIHTQRDITPLSNTYT
jgi:hypothetical protein